MNPNFTNSLINETSPYLLQHAHNPVDWYPWGAKALDKAAKEDKLLIISIGYAACHWCHVMERESFEDTMIAQIMNDHFVSVKVDREERPDVDQVYMNASYLISGSGGWPLNAIALPDGRPVFAGTYFRPGDWSKILQYYSTQYATNKEKLIEQADRILAGINEMDEIGLNQSKAIFKIDELEGVVDSWLQSLDKKYGGRTGSPKFPMPVNANFLLHYADQTGNDVALEQVTLQLERMANGGIYDHLGGGFARYATDAKWMIPHFEKMLYDNAQLVSLYAKAWQKTNNPLFKSVVEETLAFLQRELMDETGGFYASIDADSEGEEGKFYVWTLDEIRQTLGKTSSAFETVYNITMAGNWESGKNILHLSQSPEQAAVRLNMQAESLDSTLEKARELLFDEREKRARPRTDDKILTSWNALTITAYIDAYRAFSNPDYLAKAKTNARFLLANLKQDDGSLKRSYKAGKATINAFLDDYALLIDALIGLYQATFEEEWLYEAKAFADYAIQHFWSAQTGMFYYTSVLDAPLIARKTETSDNVIPASNSVMAKAMYMLGLYFNDPTYMNISQVQMNNMKSTVIKHISFYANWADLMIWFIKEPFEIAIAGDKCEAIRQSLSKHYLPDVLMMGAEKNSKLDLMQNKWVNGKTLIYVCKNKTCRLPVATAEKALKQMEAYD